MLKQIIERLDPSSLLGGLRPSPGHRERRFTLSKVQSLAAKESRIGVLESRVIDAFYEGLRADVFNAVRSRAEEGDWFVHLDEDEFYHVFVVKSDYWPEV